VLWWRCAKKYLVLVFCGHSVEPPMVIFVSYSCYLVYTVKYFRRFMVGFFLVHVWPNKQRLPSTMSIKNGVEVTAGVSVPLQSGRRESGISSPYPDTTALVSWCFAVCSDDERADDGVGRCYPRGFRDRRGCFRFSRPRQSSWAGTPPRQGCRQSVDSFKLRTSVRYAHCDISHQFNFDVARPRTVSILFLASVHSLNAQQQQTSHARMRHEVYSVWPSGHVLSAIFIATTTRKLNLPTLLPARCAKVYTFSSLTSS